MKIESRLITSAFISSIGNWLTFLAIALFVNERYGGHQVAWTFLIQSLPPLILSRNISNWVPPQLKFKVFITLQCILALNVFSLIWNPSLLHIYTFLIISSFAKTFTNPILNSLIGDWVKPDNLEKIFTKIGAIEASCLTLVPIIGGAIATQQGFQLLFILDAISFFLAAIILLPKPKTVHQNNEDIPKSTKEPLFHRFLKKPQWKNKAMEQSLNLWFFYIAVGAFLNGIEFHSFNWHGLNKDSIGIIIGFWGGGNLLAFIVSHFKKDKTLSISISSIIYSLGLVMFLLIKNPYTPYLGFLLSGFACAILGGKIRSSIQKNIASNENSLTVWGYAAQITHLVNIIFYASLGGLIQVLPYETLAVSLSFLTIFFSIKVLRQRSSKLQKQIAMVS